MVLDDNFIIMVKCNQSLEDFAAWFRSHYPHLEWRSATSASSSSNHLFIKRNTGPDYQTEELLQYNFVIEVYSRRLAPISEEDMLEQAQFASGIVSTLEAEGCDAEVLGFDIWKYIKRKS